MDCKSYLDRAEREKTVKRLNRILRIFSSKWALLVISELYEHPMRFNDLSRASGISTKSLSNTLKELEQYGVVCRRVLPTAPVTVEYLLTESGIDTCGIFREMERWGQKWLSGEQASEEGVVENETAL